MDEDISTLVLLNKAIPLLLTKPFNCSFCHCLDLLNKFFSKPQAATLAKEKILESPTDLEAQIRPLTQKSNGVKYEKKQENLYFSLAHIVNEARKY